MRPSAPQERKRFRWNGEHEMEWTGPTGERRGERRREEERQGEKTGQDKKNRTKKKIMAPHVGRMFI